MQLWENNNRFLKQAWLFCTSVGRPPLILLRLDLPADHSLLHSEWRPGVFIPNLHWPAAWPCEVLLLFYCCGEDIIWKQSFPFPLQTEDWCFFWPCWANLVLPRHVCGQIEAGLILSPVSVFTYQSIFFSFLQSIGSPFFSSSYVQQCFSKPPKFHVCLVTLISAHVLSFWTSLQQKDPYLAYLCC